MTKDTIAEDTARMALDTEPVAEPGTLAISARAPFDAAGVLAFLRSRTIVAIDAVAGSTYERSCRVGDRIGFLRVEAGESALALTVSDALVPDLRFIVERVRRMFDVDADAEEIGRRLSQDPLLRRMVRRRPGVRIAGAWDPFEVSIRAIVGQQVSVAAATTIVGRIVEKYGQRVDSAVGALLFPEPAVLAGASLDGLGMPGRRSETIRRVSRAFADGALPLDGSRPLDEIVAALVALPGIGPWTAQYIALRALSEPDAFPAGDLGLRKAAGGGIPISEKELFRRAESWRPWRGYAAMLLWGSLT